MTIKSLSLGLVAGIALLAISGCASSKLHSERERQMTLGRVQKEIRVGMSSVDVAEALGSPNMVRRDSAGKETWIYDKFATEASYRNSESNIGGNASGLGMPGNVLVLGTVNAGHSRNKGSSATTQKTLTVIIRFDADDKVESFSYHSSTF
jgi:outer membrane protein assembly factor BamE (lipoprotein component of BamABCDE complex)